MEKTHLNVPADTVGGNGDIERVDRHSSGRDEIGNGPVDFLRLLTCNEEKNKGKEKWAHRIQSSGYPWMTESFRIRCSPRSGNSIWQMYTPLAISQLSLFVRSHTWYCEGESLWMVWT